MYRTSRALRLHRIQLQDLTEEPVAAPTSYWQFHTEWPCFHSTVQLHAPHKHLLSENRNYDQSSFHVGRQGVAQKIPRERVCSMDGVCTVCCTGLKSHLVLHHLKGCKDYLHSFFLLLVLTLTNTFFIDTLQSISDFLIEVMVGWHASPGTNHLS